MYIHFIFRSIFGPSKRLLFRLRPHTFQFVFAMMPNSTGNPQRETMFDHSAVPTASGFKPTSASLNMQSMIEKNMMLLALLHTSVQSGNPLKPSDQSKRPFLSFSVYFEKSHDFARQKEMPDDRYKTPHTVPTLYGSTVLSRGAWAIFRSIPFSMCLLWRGQPSLTRILGVALNAMIGKTLDKLITI